MLTRNVPLHFAKTGQGQQVATFPWLSSDFNDVVAVAKQGVGFGPYGQPWFDQFGNTFSLGISAGVLAFGNVLTWGGSTGGAVGGYQATTQNGAGTIRSITPTAAVTPKSPTDVGNWVYDATLTLDTDRLKLIKSQASTTSLFISLLDPKFSNLQADPDAYSVAPANTDALNFIRPYEFTKLLLADLAKCMPVGIALGTTADKDPFFRQTGGLAMVNAAGNVTALVASQPAVPDGVTDGHVKGSATSAMNQVGIAAAAYSAAAGKSAPVFLTLTCA
jgi:hypothetical protein